MAALNFPTGPTVGQVYRQGSKSWEWDGASWNISANFPKLPITYIGGDIGSGSTNQQQLIFPAHQNGDWLFASIGSQSGTAPTPPSGWTSVTSVVHVDSARSFTVMYHVSNGTITTVNFPMVGSGLLSYSSGLIFRNVSGIGNIVTYNLAGVGSTTPYPAIQCNEQDNTSRVLYATFSNGAVDRLDTELLTTIPAHSDSQTLYGTTTSVTNVPFILPYITTNTGARIRAVIEIKANTAVI